MRPASALLVCALVVNLGIVAGHVWGRQREDAVEAARALATPRLASFVLDDRRLHDVHRLYGRAWMAHAGLREAAECPHGTRPTSRRFWMGVKLCMPAARTSAAR